MERFEEPEVEVIAFDEDVITTSCTAQSSVPGTAIETPEAP